MHGAHPTHGLSQLFSNIKHDRPQGGMSVQFGPACARRSTVAPWSRRCGRT